MGLFDKFKKGLTKSRNAVFGRIGQALSGKKLDESLFEELEEVLISADVGVDTSLWLVDEVRKQAKAERAQDGGELPRLLQSAMEKALSDCDTEMAVAPDGPSLYMFVGVNGVGKTTSIGKLARHYLDQGKKVILAAGDTFRAAAIDQLLEWGERAGCDVIRHAPGADPAAVIYDAIVAGKSRGVDVILCDTAGRLHNKANLMAELAKMAKVAKRELPGSPHEVLLVLDGTTGQNALSQTKSFQEVADVTGIVVTKLDGTAKGGVILPIVREFGLSVKWVGLGESIDDLEPFDASIYSEAICQIDT
ncbi:signal recognition particle-docking protein FtsY [Alicyclobacillus sp. SO9]|uniref:signal recognition particle-docking protein FtsY n=1 Tax=Alicyclobacillus sp. SO9 TaxID=2665646 RepID=UPI0018E7230F|nr:signal recognition particle-docking protein FtsY [Alicyclobacillus sp. SO9]QQE80766.1 signal recognition particle-docking protein FtsY [Alicyclobacillus sp. SO9]